MPLRTGDPRTALQRALTDRRMDVAVSNEEIERVIAEELEKDDTDIDAQLLDYCYDVVGMRSPAPLSDRKIMAVTRRVWRRVQKALSTQTEPRYRPLRLAAAVLTAVALLFASSLLPQRMFHSRSTPDGQQYVVMGIARDNTGAALAAEIPAEDSYTDAFVRLDSLEDIPKRLGYAITLPQWLPEGVRVRAVFALRNEQFDIISVQYQDGDAQILLDFTYYRDTSAFGVSYEQDEEGKTIALENGSNIYVISNEQSLWGLYQDGRVFYHIDAIGYDVNTLLEIFNSI